MELAIRGFSCEIMGAVEPGVESQIHSMCRYRPDGYARSFKFIKGLWDGYDALYHNRRFPIGFLEDIEMMLYLNNEMPVRRDYRRIFERSPIAPSEDWQLRPYQEQIVNDAMSRGYGRIQAPTGAGKCFDADTYISTPQGLIRGRDIESGSLTYSIDSDLRVTAEPIDGITTINPKACLRMVTRRGYELVATADHKLACLIQGEIIWKRIGDLGSEDVIFVARGKPAPGSPQKIPLVIPSAVQAKKAQTPSHITAEWGYILGQLTGDGSLTIRGAIRLDTPDYETFECVRLFAESLGLNSGAHKHENHWTVSISSTHLWDILDELGMCKLSIHKQIPDSILRSPPSVKSAFLSGLFDADAHASRGIEYSTSSAALAEQVHLLLLEFGIVSSLKQKPTNRHLSYRIMIYGAEIAAFNSKIGFTVDRKRLAAEQSASKKSNTNLDVVPGIQEQLNNAWGEYKKTHSRRRPATDFNAEGGKHKVLQSYRHGRRNPSKQSLEAISTLIDTESGDLKRLAQSDVYFDTVSSIKDAGIRDVMDIQVGAHHNFVANGIVTHNSVIFTWMLCKLGVPSIVIVPTNDILDQTLRKFEEIAGVVGVHVTTDWLMETERAEHGQWCVATWQVINYVLNEIKKGGKETAKETETRLALRNQVRKLLGSFGAVIVDEAHCAGAKAVYKVLSNLPARWRWGTSATPFRPSGDELRLHGALGPVLSGVTPSELIDLGYLVEPLIEFYVIPRPLEPLSRTDDYPTAVKEGIVHNMARNHWLAEKAFELHALEDRTVLVMVTQIAHGNIMQKLIRQYFKNPSDVQFVHGTLRPKRRKELSRQFREGEFPIAISSSVWNEGVDFPRISGIVIASPHKSKNMSMQRLGRGLRPDPDSGKRDCRVIETFNELPFIAHHDKLREANYKTERRFTVTRMGRANMEDIVAGLEAQE